MHHLQFVGIPIIRILVPTSSHLPSRPEAAPSRLVSFGVTASLPVTDRWPDREAEIEAVGPEGLEPPTCSSGKGSRGY